ncbi:MAG: hypothetical protein JST77_00180 [Acidobacteria bacterium]|nr:hypothetical protein [Acidobacteriota bacterium]
MGDLAIKTRERDGANGKSKFPLTGAEIGRRLRGEQLTARRMTKYDEAN